MHRTIEVKAYTSTAFIRYFTNIACNDDECWVVLDEGYYRWSGYVERDQIAALLEW